MNLYSVKKYIETIEHSCENDPELLIDTLHKAWMESHLLFNMLYESELVNPISNYVAQYFEQLSVLQDCNLSFTKGAVSVSLPSKKGLNLGTLVTIDYKAKTYCIRESAFRFFEQGLNQTLEYTPFTLDPWFLQFKNLTLRKRLLLAKERLLKGRWNDLFFVLTTSKNYFDEMIAKKESEIEEQNKNALAYYNSRKKTLGDLQEYGPEYLASAKVKVEEICKYFSSIGYKED